MKLPNPAPICAIGPSAPPDPPEPIVSTVAKNLMTGTRFLMCPPFLWKLLMAASVPWPFASGAKNLTSSPARNAPAAGRATIRT